MNNTFSVKDHLQKMHELIHDYALRYHRDPQTIKLLGATKGQSLEKIRAAIDAGLSILGENYLQESLEKFPALADKNIEWHFIGPIQSNKIKKIAEHFDWVQSVSSEKMAKSLHDHRPTHLPPLNICIEVNISGEASKSGVSPENVFSLATICQTLPRIKLRGLMAIPRLASDLVAQRAALSPLKKLYDELIHKGFSLDTLSMGMSQDLEAAIAEGATLVRIGTAIFGNRT